MFCSVQFSHSVMSDSLQPHRLQHIRLPCPSLTPRNYSNSCPLSQWCHPTISSSVVPFSSRLQVLWSLLILSPSSSSSFLILLGKSYLHKWFQLSSINWCFKGLYFYSWPGPIYTAVWRNLYLHVPNIPSMHRAQREFTTISKPAPPPLSSHNNWHHHRLRGPGYISGHHAQFPVPKSNRLLTYKMFLIFCYY